MAYDYNPNEALPGWGTQNVGVPIPKTNPGFEQQVQQMQDYSGRSPQQFQQDINQGIDQSNLMGPSDQNNPEDQALSARGNQIYQSQMSQLTRNSVVPAAQRKVQLQSNQIDNQAALYSNYQQRMQMAYQQASFQRQSAITQAGIQYQAYNSMFQGVGFAGGWALKGLFNATNKAPSEGMDLGFDPELDNFNTENSPTADFTGQGGWAPRTT